MIVQRQTETAAECSSLARDMEILQRHLDLAGNVEAAAERIKNVTSNIEQMLAKNVVADAANMLRGYHGGDDVCSIIASQDALRLHKAELLKEIRANTVDAAEKALAAFEVEHKAVLTRNGVI